jgi:hypothetical protein
VILDFKPPIHPPLVGILDPTPHPPEGKNIHYLLSSPFYSSNYYAIFICAGKYYVVDASYPNRPGYLSPYKGKRYHLPEWHRGTESNTPN